MRSDNLGEHSQPKWENSSKERTYQRWQAMKQRVRTAPNYKDVTVCKEWLEDYDQFVKDLGICPDGYSLDRIDNTKGYSKGNCRWVPRADQNRNRRNCIMVAGMTLKEYARSVGIPYGTLYHRIKKLGMDVEEAVTYKRGT